MSTSAASPRLFAKDSIERWVLLRLALLLSAVGLLFLAVTYSVLDQRFDEYDVERYTQELLRVNAVFAQDQAGMETMLKDYAYWDDTRDFVLGDDSADFVSTNFTDESVANLHISGVIISTADETPLISLQVDVDGKIGPMPAEFLARLKPYLATLNPTQSAATSNSSLFTIDEQPFLIARSTITDSTVSLPGSGSLYFLRLLDERYLSRLRALTAVPFRLLAAPPAANFSSTVSQQDSAAGQRWQLTQQLGELPAMIQVSGTTTLQRERRLTHFALAVNAAGLVFCSLFGVYLIVHFRLLRRLRSFSVLADRHRLERDPEIRWPVQGDDELDNLGTSLNELLAEVESRHQDLTHLAEHDPLTGIGNRRLLMSRLAALLNDYPPVPNKASCLLLLDLDGFKLLNDGLGHEAGDDVLKVVAQRVLELLRSDDTVARLGGDEFAILLEGVSVLNALPFAERLLKELERPISYQGHSLSVRASAGLTEVDAALSKEEVLRNADLAMYEAKRRGKGQVTAFDITFLDLASRRMQLEEALQIALNDQQLEVWFQPIVDARSGAVVGMEALSRWPFCGTYIPPDEFIGIAEDTGMIARLGRFVFDQVGAALQSLRVEQADLQCNINLSVRQFRDTDLVADLAACLRCYGLPSSALHLELTESMVAEAETEILPTMRQLVAQGFKFHLDDFGTGYSSLDRLRELPFDTLKIDRSFVTPLSRGDEVMARNIINMGRELGMALIAEGVENEIEVTRLLALGCSQIQGYYFARPMPLHDLRLWFAERRLQQEQQEQQPAQVAMLALRNALN